MIVQDSNYMEDYIKPANILADINEKEHQCYFVNELGSTTYFRRVQLPSVNLRDQITTKQNLEQKINNIYSQYELSQEFSSKYIFKYEEFIISYPYICLTHQPIVSTLKTLIGTKLNYSTKINLMIQISNGLKYLHQKGLTLQQISLNNIIIVSYFKNEYKIAFSNIYKLHKQNEMRQGSSNINSKVKNEEKTHSIEEDILNLGLLFFQILFEKVYIKNKAASQYPTGAPTWLINFIQKMMNLNVRNRYHLNDVITILKKAYLCAQTTAKFL